MQPISYSDAVERRHHAWPRWLWSAVFVAGWPNPAFARDAAAAAQVLFEQGRDLLRAGEIAEACPRLEESQRLDPANGTLLALAMCHEAQGKIASAWAEFAQVARLAKRDGQVEREVWATERLVALKPSLSLLDLRVPEPVRRMPEVEVRLNGAPMQGNAWDTPLPVDGGEYRISVSAKGYRTWEHVVNIAPERANHVVVVPVLVRDTSAGSESTMDARSPSLAVEARLDEGASPPPPANDEWTAVQWVGVSSVGLGVATWLVGAGTMYAALDKYSAANDCTDLCRHRRQTDALALGDWATGFAVGGAALVLAGGAMYLWGATPEEGETTTAVSVDVGKQKAAVVFVGTF